MSNLTYRQKILYWRLGPNLVILAALIALMASASLARTRHPAALPLLVTLYYLGTLGEALYMMYFAVDTLTDERDRILDLRASKSAYAMLSGGIFLLIILGSSRSFDSSTQLLLWLFLIWLLSRIVRDASELRLHAGHEGLWPDAIVAGTRARSRRRFEARMAAINARAENPSPGESNEADRP